MIFGGNGPTCQRCNVYAFAPRTDGADHAVRTCTCGVEWEIDVSASEEIDVARANGEELRPDHWGDEQAGGMWQVVHTVLSDPLASGLVSAFIYDQLKRAPELLAGSPRQIGEDEAVSAAVQAIAKRWTDILAEQLWPTSFERGDVEGSLIVELVSDNLTWRVQVVPQGNVATTTMLKWPKWPPYVVPSSTILESEGPVAEGNHPE